MQNDFFSYLRRFSNSLFPNLISTFLGGFDLLDFKFSVKYFRLTFLISLFVWFSTFSLYGQPGGAAGQGEGVLGCRSVCLELR